MKSIWDIHDDEMTILQAIEGQAMDGKGWDWLGWQALADLNEEFGRDVLAQSIRHRCQNRQAPGLVMVVSPGKKEKHLAWFNEKSRPHKMGGYGPDNNYISSDLFDNLLSGVGARVIARDYKLYVGLLEAERSFRHACRMVVPTQG